MPSKRRQFNGPNNRGTKRRMNTPMQGQQEPKTLSAEEEHETIVNFLSQMLMQTNFPKHQMIAPRVETMFKTLRSMIKKMHVDELQRSLSEEECTEGTCCKEKPELTLAQ